MTKTNSESTLKGCTVLGDYSLKRLLGSGAFGDIYLAINTKSSEEFAVKVELVTASNPRLMYESRAYEILAGSVGVPHTYFVGADRGYNCLVMDLLGPSLEELFNFCGRKFSLKTILLLADQLISRMEVIHSKSLIHRDMKPDNLLMGLGSNINKVFVIDFGLAKKYRDPETYTHIACRQGKSLIGTPRYASINAHIGTELSRRDDLESLAYVLIYFHRGRLPWQGLNAVDKKQKYDKIRDMKRSIPVEELCEGLPPEFVTYLKYCRGLGFSKTPDYIYVRQLFRFLFRSLDYKYDNIFDWTESTQKADPSQCVNQ